MAQKPVGMDHSQAAFAKRLESIFLFIQMKKNMNDFRFLKVKLRLRKNSLCFDFTICCEKLWKF